MKGGLTGSFDASNGNKENKTQIQKELPKYKKFLRNYQESIETRKKRQDRFNKKVEEHKKSLDRLTEERNRRKEKKRKIEKGKLDPCNHYFIFSHKEEGKIVTYCQYCSVIKKMDYNSWRKEMKKRGFDLENPNPEVIQI